MTFQATTIPGGFASVYDTANGKTHYLLLDKYPAGNLTQKQLADLSEFILSAAGDWVKKPAGIRTHDVLAGFIAHRAGAAPVKQSTPANVRDALAVLVAYLA